MQPTTLLLIVVLFTLAAFLAGRERASLLGGDIGRRSSLHSLPNYYGYFLAFAWLLPALFVLFVWSIFETRVMAALLLRDFPAVTDGASAAEISLFLNGVRNLAYNDMPSMAAASGLMREASGRLLQLDAASRLFETICVLAAATLSTGLAWRRISPALRARNVVERIVEAFLLGASGIALLTTVGIVLSLLFEAMRFFQQVSLAEFLFGLDWSPQTAIRDNQVGASGSFGIVPLLGGTLLITVIAMLLAVPIGLLGAIYMAEFATARFRDAAKPLLEVLAGIPTVVYGFFAVLMVAPAVRSAGQALGLEVSSESALAAGLVMGIMIIPLVSSLSDDAIRAVPTTLREGALALGATRAEVIRGVVLPVALPGIAGGILLAVSRAIGETMIVVMAAGLAARLTVNPLEAVTTVTVQMVTLLVGDQAFNSPRTLAAFALGLVLFLITMVLNIAGLRIVRRFREQHV